MSNKLSLAIIVCFALLLRLWNIESVPPALNWDEVSHGYNAYSILETGKDEWGVPMPYSFRAYGDYKLPVYVYLTAVSEKIFGLNEFSVRLPSVLAGTLSVLFVYLLALEMFKRQDEAILSAFLMAILPWSFFLSRIALEANVSMAMVVTAVYLFLKGIARPRILIASFAIFGISMWTYNSARVFVPLLLIGLVVIFRRELAKLAKNEAKVIGFALCVLAILVIPVFIQFSQEAGVARYKNVQIIDDGAIAQIEERRNESNLPVLISRIIYNRPAYFGFRFIGGYLGHFGINFLFLKGGDNFQFSVPGHGILYLVNAPFLLIGFWFFLKRRNNRENALTLLWLFIAPVAASLTREAPHVLRSILMLPPLVLLVSVGTVYSFKKIFKSNRVFIFVYVVILSISFADYIYSYTSTYRNRYSQVWQYGYKQIAELVREKYDNYEKIIITKKYGEPHEFMLYYMNWPPGRYLADKSRIQFSQSNWYWTDKFDKFYFVNDWDIPRNGAKFTLESGTEIECASCLLVTAGSSPENWKKLDTVYFLDGSVAFEIYEH